MLLETFSSLRLEQEETGEMSLNVLKEALKLSRAVSFSIPVTDVIVLLEAYRPVRDVQL
jgi:hypothetical protein